MNKRIYLSSPTMHGDEMQYIKEAFDTNWVAPLGKNVDEFEREAAAYVGVAHGAALVSGTAALHLAIKQVGVGHGDYVFCSDLTFAATVNPVSYEGGVQVFIDSDYDTWNMCPHALEAAFEKYPNPKAVIVVHLYGVPAKINEIKAICQKHSVPLIEDAAESLGATYEGKQTGSFGELSVLSFNGNKIITTSGGGMLLSDDKSATEKAKFWATQSREKFLHYEHNEIGYNYRMSNIVAGIGRGQLLHLDSHIAAKKRIYEKYKQAFSDLPVKMNPYTSDSEPNFWLSCMIINEEIDVTPANIIAGLEEKNAEARPIWKPMHLQPVFKGRDFITVSDKPVISVSAVSESIFNRGVCLPSDIKMSDEELELIIDTVRRLF
ncbi:MAG: DegT/DnrJ/EryC1/StrS family aminotransferase [Oscillospiraceae bacterium]|nr:DegT/DnrJ/EryC1/StrS family aminotransferase [Oscillospiraceae bacterium]